MLAARFKVESKLISHTAKIYFSALGLKAKKIFDEKGYNLPYLVRYSNTKKAVNK